MSELILYKGKSEIRVAPSETTQYLYKIGGGEVSGEGFIELNDATRLNKIAEEVRDHYTKWIYSFNDEFLESKLVIDELSLFFISDLSCKRSEFFDTYDSICNLFLLKEKVDEIKITRAKLIGLDRSFVIAFRSLFPDVPVQVEQKPRDRFNLVRRVVSDLIYALNVMGVIALTMWTRTSHQPKATKRKFLSFFPSMFDDIGVETKYRTFIKYPEEVAVMVLADGMHQNISLRQYRRFSQKLKAQKFSLIDEYLRPSDVRQGLVWWLKLWVIFARRRDEKRTFMGIDVSGYFRRELRFSVSRIMRLLVLKGAVHRFLTRCRPLELYYYPVEYPLGRMVSWVCALASPETQKVGFQMSTVSPRRLEQFMAPGEGSTCLPFLRQSPLPDRMLAEDERAASIYRFSGYHGVEVMSRVYRYEYLSKIRPEKRENLSLVVLGLHDGPLLLNVLSDKIRQESDISWLVKPHPRAANNFLDDWKAVSGVTISSQSIEELLATVSEVYVTYSSVGLEAKTLGIRVHVVDVPGHVNTSPLIDGDRGSFRIEGDDHLASNASFP
tara:strand:+ start:5669 stop:7330 length:1662 start_codon:yes stop_codon:yes gene_type:complete